MKAFSKLKQAMTGAVIAVVMLAVPATVFAGFYPADRQTYTCATPTSCVGADHVVFDSFTNNPVVGDERPFFSGSLNNANVQDRIKVSDGQTIVLRAYVHNNADPNKISVDAATARNVKMKVLIPTATQKDQNLVAFISAANANPGTINDTMSLYGDDAFSLEYVNGSAVFDHRADGKNMISEKLNDTIIAGGTYLGDIHGCFDYSGYVTLQVKVHMPSTPQPPTPAYSCDAFNITADVNRTVKVTDFKSSNTKDIKFDHANINWGDNSADLNDASPVGKTHQYAKDGIYTVTATAHFQLIANGSDLSASSPACVKSVTFSPEQPPKVTPPPTTPPSTPAPTTLVNTGPGQVAGIFATTSALGAGAYRWMLGRRLSRQ